MSGHSLKGWIYLRNTFRDYANKYHIDLKDDAVKPTFLDFENYEGFSENKYRKIIDKIF
jgi:hypothetical protein